MYTRPYLEGVNREIYEQVSNEYMEIIDKGGFIDISNNKLDRSQNERLEELRNDRESDFDEEFVAEEISDLLAERYIENWYGDEESIKHEARFIFTKERFRYFEDFVEFYNIDNIKEYENII